MLLVARLKLKIKITANNREKINANLHEIIGIRLAVKISNSNDQLK